MSLFPKKIEEKFTAHLKGVLKVAEEMARDFSHKEIGVEHVLFCIISQEGSLGSNMLGEEKFDIKELRSRIEKLSQSKKWTAKFSKDLKEIFQKMALYANRYNHSYVGTEHLLAAILESGNPKVNEIFKSMKINPNNLRDKLDATLESSLRFSGIVEISENSKNNLQGGILGISGMQMPGNMNDMGAQGILGMQPASRQSALEAFCVNINEELEEREFDPVIGREEEIAKVVNILSRKSKNNPILVGEPGVGKTAIVQGLAKRINDGDVPSNLSGKKIYSLDLGLMIAGTVFRGEFESRLKDVIAEAQDDPDVILFIDEIHTIIGAGNTGGAGSLDAANILKPPLSRGEISCIGATTIDEYRKHFKKDAALDRRFQMVLVEEPTVEEAKKILLGVRSFYEKHHNLTISDAAVDAAVDLSHRFINDRFLPDKALDVLDEAAALIRSKYGNKNYFKEIKVLRLRVDELEEEKEGEVESEQYEKALQVKTEEDEVRGEIKKMDELQQKENAMKIKVPVTEREIGEVIKQMTGVPVNELLKEEKEKLMGMEKDLEKRVVGQREAIESLSRAIRRSRSGIADGNRPVGVFMFLGPTGVGKTELVKALAEELYKDKKALIKVDMSEFMERHNVSRLVGAPAGYVGFEEGGKLTEQVRLHPYSIVLFDEVEKAHPDVFNIMLQIFEDGELTDAAGHKVDFRNTIIVMTSNLGTDELTDGASWGFLSDEGRDKKNEKDEARERYIETKESVIENLKEEFRPEFLNRIDKILVFNPLSRKDIKTILKNKFGEFQKRLLEKQGIKIDMDTKVLEYIADKSFDPNEGARLVRRNLQDMIEDLVSEKIVGDEIKAGNKVRVSLQQDKIIIR
ncbi:MAG: ATP-dependent Clp protease ATP-binding subunit [Candidatus Pacebacteria bacterium]|nr:ATP-dependent Clp protease ATP-binding subunit [Candidatus Paceibacterota bacterium]